MLETLTRYRIIEKLGAGGMGEVYKAKDLTLLRTVAIKVISKTTPRAPGAESRFLLEARAASALNHPNVITIHEIGETDEHAYIVMEYVSGRSLGDLISSRALTPDRIIDISRQICDALIEAHSRKIIHRDIKPENIIVSEREQVKLLDFGLAKPLDALSIGDSGATAQESLTSAGVIVGTLAYMSPEQLRGGPLDERTDIFSFGILLYRMITGRFPFSGATPVEIAASILKESPVAIDKLETRIPRGVITIINRCLEKDRDGRYSSFVEIKREVEALKRELTAQSEILETTLLLTPDDKRRAGLDLQVEKLAPVQASPGERQPAERFRSSSRASSKDASQQTPTILVLPLEEMSASESGSFIGVGLAHAITTSLAKVRALAVLSKLASMERKAQAAQGARELARELGATIVLEGEVMRAGQMIAVMARLIDVMSGRVLWGEQYRGAASDIFDMQDAVCSGVAAALKVGMSETMHDRLARPATTNIEAFELYSKGRAFLDRLDLKESIDSAIQSFEDAIKLDPEFALAYAGLSETYWQKYRASLDSAWVERAIAAADRALVLDPYQAQVHTSLGYIYFETGKVDKAISELERAIDLQPLNDDAFRRLGRCYERKGEMERAITYFKKAIEIRPRYWDYYDGLGLCYLAFGRYREAAEQFRQVITLQPDNHHGYNNLGAVYLLLGNFEDSLAMHKRAIEIHPNSESYSNLGTEYFYLSRYEEAIAAFKSAIALSPANDIFYYNLGDAYSRVGMHQEAYEQYERAYHLLSERLRVKGDNGEMLGQLAMCQVKLRSDEEALANIERAIRLEPHNIIVMYQRAVIYALAGQVEEAIEFLTDALANGYSRSEAGRDPDLEALRDDEKFKSLISAR
ncbi:MAG TPA: tetratricopeptide repeat protein [Blastocatellia bacterium]|nr:tetratricopeptide repeat protein [Blastocatellia bacterium]